MSTRRKFLSLLLGSSAAVVSAPLLPKSVKPTFNWNGYDQSMIHTSEIAEWPLEVAKFGSGETRTYYSWFISNEQYATKVALEYGDSFFSESANV